MRLISACLVGINCKYNGKNNPEDLPEEVVKEYKQGKLIPVCPEQLGGFSTPRDAEEIRGGSGEDVLAEKAVVVTENNKNSTALFIKGAKEVLKIAKDLNIKEVIFKQRSPSCGCGQIYDGSFTKTVRKGDGVTTALLKQNGIWVITEEDL